MCRAVLSTLVVVAVVFVATAAPAAAETPALAGAGIVDDTPVAIVVRAGVSEIASYRRGAHRTGPTWTCGFHDLGASTDTVLPTVGRDRVNPEPGRYYGFLCRDDDGRLVHERYLRFEPEDPLGGLFVGERAAARAVEALTLPEPALRYNPPGEQVVGLSTWLWVDHPWDAPSATAAIGAVTSTVTARPLDVRWTTGDGGRRSCPGPGTPYDPKRRPSAQATGCRHTYLWPSYRQPSGSYRLWATVRYEVSWAASNGERGSLGEVTRSGGSDVVVREIQAVVR